MKCPVCDSTTGLRVSATVRREDNFDLRDVTCLECNFQGQTETRIVYAKFDGEFVHIKLFVKEYAERLYKQWAGKRMAKSFIKQDKLFSKVGNE